ncbi:MAG: hypothetical protein R8K47_07075 [Mariprofundaceae bacterium]
MIRNILIAVVFFFGPALAMLALRFMLEMLLARLRRQRQAPEIIDITPREPMLPRWFWPVALALGLLSGFWAWQTVERADAPPQSRIYVPAHIDEQGRLIPGHWVDAAKTKGESDTARPAPDRHR